MAGHCHLPFYLRGQHREAGEASRKAGVSASRAPHAHLERMGVPLGADSDHPSQTWSVCPRGFLLTRFGISQTDRSMLAQFGLLPRIIMYALYFKPTRIDSR